MPPQKELADPASAQKANAETPLVDVNLITYNHEKFVARAIESVLKQKTDFAYRLIIGDDCSTDKTQSIIREYAQQYPQLIQTLLGTEHLGIEHKDRMGIQVLRLNTSEYVALLDGDDYWTDPNKLQREVDFLRLHKECSLCFHNAEMFYEDGTRPSTNLRPPDQKEFSTLEDVINWMVPIPCTIMFRRRFLGQLPDWFYKETNADWIMCVLLAENGPIGYINEVMAAYRIHAGGIWSRLTGRQQLRGHISTYKRIDDHLNFKYQQLISEKISELKELHARTCLGQYHKAAKNGDLKTAFRLLMEVTRYAPLEILRPRPLAAVLKNGLVGVLRKPGEHN